MEEIKIQTEFIKLQQVLKLSGMVDQGSDVKRYLSEGQIRVNDSIVTERGKKIRHGDIVALEGVGKIIVIYEP